MLCLKIDRHCQNCHSKINLTPHHIIHKSLGGDDSLGNLITLCLSSCHRLVHDGKLDLIDLLAKLKHDKNIVWRWEESYLRLLAEKDINDYERTLKKGE